MKHSKKALQAVYALGLGAAFSGQRKGPEEDVRLGDALAGLFRAMQDHPVFGPIEGKKRNSITEPVRKALKGVPDAEVIGRFAPDVPPELAETAYELALAALLGDHVYSRDTEGAYLHKLAAALSLPIERSRPIEERVAALLMKRDGYGVEKTGPAADAERTGLKAVFAIGAAAAEADGEVTPEEAKPLLEKLHAHPRFSGMPFWVFSEVLGEAAKEAEGVPAADVIKTFAPRVPPEMAEFAFEVACAVMFADSVFDWKGEVDFLSTLGGKLGLSTERTTAIVHKIIAERSAAGLSHRNKE